MLSASGTLVSAALKCLRKWQGDYVSVYRVNKTRDFTVMGNTHLRDKNLSLKAVGLLSKMLSFNDGWQFSTRGLAAICKEGPDAILSALKELEKNGYLVRHRGRDSKGRLVTTEFDIYESPQAGLPHREKPHRENPDVDSPDVENPHRDNPAQINTKVMRILRAEEKRLRRSNQGVPISGTEGKTAEERASVLSLSYVSYEGCEDLEPYWLIDSSSMEESVMFWMSEKEFRATLTPRQLDIYLNCIIGGQSKIDYAAANNMQRQSVYNAETLIMKKAKYFFKKF